jgi:protein SCO1/2
MLLGLVVGAGSAAVLVWDRLAPPGPASETLGKALIGGPFSLIDHTGKRVTEKDFAGRLTLVYFGFTNCPDVCPSGLQVISAALDKLGPKADKITPIFITLDPLRDTPEQLRDYLKSFHPRLVGLTGSVEEVAAVTKAYRVYFQKVADEKLPGSYSIDHSAYMYLMDGSGEFLTHFPQTVTVDKLASALAKVL